jgi:putative sterol carrier protein
MVIAFSDPWAQAWGAALNGSQIYRDAAATWEGSIAVVATGGSDGPAAAVFLDVWHGQCRGAREATGADLAAADFVLEAPPAAWKQVLSSQVSPVMALLTGQVTLARGELTRLLPYAAAAKELVQLAGTIDTEFPASW